MQNYGVIVTFKQARHVHFAQAFISLTSAYVTMAHGMRVAQSIAKLAV